jgi:hypothetical protein
MELVHESKQLLGIAVVAVVCNQSAEALERSTAVRRGRAGALAEGIGEDRASERKGRDGDGGGARCRRLRIGIHGEKVST